MWLWHEGFLSFKLTVPQRNALSHIFFFFYYLLNSFDLSANCPYPSLQCMINHFRPCHVQNSSNKEKFYVLLLLFIYLFLIGVSSWKEKEKKGFSLHWFNQLHGFMSASRKEFIGSLFNLLILIDVNGQYF